PPGHGPGEAGLDDPVDQHAQGRPEAAGDSDAREHEPGHRRPPSPSSGSASLVGVPEAGSVLRASGAAAVLGDSGVASALRDSGAAAVLGDSGVASVLRDSGAASARSGSMGSCGRAVGLCVATATATPAHVARPPRTTVARP